MNIIIVLFGLETIINFNFINCLYSTKTYYYDSFTEEQLDFINTESNYQVDGCT